MMGLDLGRALDPVLLAIDAGITPDDWQAEVLRLQPRRTLLLCARQTGKSTVSALLALHAPEGLGLGQEREPAAV